MGRELAAVALAIVSTKEVAHFQTSPGGYFHGMVTKAKAGELHLERTVWALRRGSEPEQQQASAAAARRGGYRAPCPCSTVAAAPVLGIEDQPPPLPRYSRWL
jgi:hypothetical protein